MATAAAKRKFVFVKVDQLKPVTSGHTLIAKVISSKIVLKKARATGGPGQVAKPTRISECLVGDETGHVLFTSRNDQVDVLKPGNTVIIRNAKIDMFK